MVIIDIESNTSVGGLTLGPAGMHCPSWDDAFVSSHYKILTSNGRGLHAFVVISVSVVVRLCRQQVERASDKKSIDFVNSTSSLVCTGHYSEDRYRAALAATQ